LTNAPLFKQKLDLLGPLVVETDVIDDDDSDNDDEYGKDGNSSRGSSNSDTKMDLRTIYFCIGTDTLQRLVDPKYYNNSQEQMYDVLNNQMPDCHFVVGGRLEQQKIQKNQSSTSTSASAVSSSTTRKGSAPKFVTGQEYIRKLPTELQSKFTFVPNFRADVSSTEIRNNTKNYKAGGKREEGIK
jgi:nicotinic acid mononucleotide adenylyltransferase